MFARLIVPAVVSALVFGTAALAAGTSTTTAPTPKDQNKVQTAAMNSAARCTALQAQFDTEIKTHGSASKAKAAEMLRTQGGALCSKGQHEAGVAKIEQALKDLGVKPTM
jgi:hypothetical protein